MKSRLGLAAFGAGLLALAAAPSAHAQTAYAIAQGGTSLIRFNNISASTTATLAGLFNVNGVAQSLDALDFRLNGVLYGYSDATNTLYTVNTNTGALTAFVTGTGAGATNTFLLGMDFNPTIDRVRIVTDSTQNLVYNPNAQTQPTVNTPLAYGATDVNFGANPLIIDNAYSNDIPGQATTIQYGIDYGLDSLVTIANNAGTLATVGALGVNINDTQPFVGFDIFTTAGGVNTAYALLDTTSTGAAPTLYTINLATGAATARGAVGGGFTQVYSLAVTPGATAPEPGTLALALLGGGALVGSVAVRRRRK